MLDTLSPQSTKHRIMNAAEEIVVAQGSAHLTFDELVKQTGLSKGGILYHYPSKKILLRAMVKRMVTEFDSARAGFARKSDGTGLTGAKSYILASFDQHERRDRSSMALMAAAANDPELLEVVREHFRRNFDEIRATGKHATLAAMLYLVMDGLWLLDAFKLCDLNDAERGSLKTMLMKLADA